MRNIAIFASGTGSNFQAIINAVSSKELKANITILISDKPNCKAIEKAIAKNIHYFAFKAKNYSSKEACEKDLLIHLEEHKVDLIVLAGYMRLIGPTLLKKYPNRIINIHPSLLPTFKGMDALGQAMKANVTVTGVTVHFVDAGMDTGAIISQESLNIESFATREEIETAIHKIEHKLYPKVINKVLEDL